MPSGFSSPPLSSLLERLDVISVSNPAGRNPEELFVSEIVYDSRELPAGGLFCALPGIHQDGHDYIGEALKRGASCIVAERSPEACGFKPGAAASSRAVFVRVRERRAALSALSAGFNGDPSRSLRVIGVTGTDGKSSTAWFLYQLLKNRGTETGLISTVCIDSRGEPAPPPGHFSTPEAPLVHRLLREMKESGKRCAVLESTSHGLSPQTKRLADVSFNGGIFTNLSHEHLEFHGTWENYRQDKGRLFEALEGEDSFALINGRDPEHDFFESRCSPGSDVFVYGTPGSALWGEAVLPEKQGQSFRLCTREGREEAFLPLPGEFNIENALAALGAASRLLGLPPEELIPDLLRLKGARGRMEIIDEGQPFRVIADFAHTPGSFEKLFPLLRKTLPAGSGRLISVFGSAGERDVRKRPRQGRIAGRYSDVIILTDEDPREEDSAAILEEIAAGIDSSGPEVLRIPPREEALQKALSLARPGDLLVFLGKGHESGIEKKGKIIPWDEVGFLRKFLRERGYHR